MIISYEKLAEEIRSELRKYIEAYKLRSLVIGISGGIDCALCCVLAKPVCDELKIPLIGRSLPIEGNKDNEISRAKQTGIQFCTNFYEACFTDLYKVMNVAFEVNMYPDLMAPDETELNRKIRRGNMKARLRMIYLYNLAQISGGMVLSTDNYTEYLLGFWTLHGDVGDFGMIQGLYKTEVYGLSKYLASMYNKPWSDILRECIHAVPTDGLGITNSDLDQLGCETYREVDDLLIKYVEKGFIFPDPAPKHLAPIQRHRDTSFKRNNPYNISREHLLRELR